MAQPTATMSSFTTDPSASPSNEPFTELDPLSTPTVSSSGWLSVYSPGKFPQSVLSPGNFPMADQFSKPFRPNCFVDDTIELPDMASIMYWIYLATTVLSLFGNAIVIVVQIFGKESSSKIRKYLLSLAIADIIMGVFSVPFTYANMLLGYWPFPLWLCPLAQFMQLTSVFVTAATLTAIGIER